MKNNLQISTLVFFFLFLIYIYNYILPFKLVIIIGVIILVLAITLLPIVSNNLNILNKQDKNTNNKSNLPMSFLEQIKRSISIFILKLLIFLIIIYFFFNLIFNSLTDNIKSLNNSNKPILEKVYEEIIDAADPSHEIDPSKQEKLKKALRVLANRIKPFIDEINSGLSDEDKENSSN